MDTNRKVFRNSGPALGAELRRISGWHFDDYSGSLFRFPAQYIEEPKPSCISHRPVKRRGTIPGVHLLNADGIVESNKLVGYLKVKVPSLIGDFLVGFGHQYPGLPSTVGAFDSPREPLLVHSKHIPGVAEETRVTDFHTIGGSQEGLQPDIDTDRPVDWRQRFKGNIITGKTDVPFARRATANGDRLDSALNRARKPELESTDVSDSEVFAIQLPACLFQSEGVVAVPTLEAGKACFPVDVGDPPEKSLVSFVQAFKHILEHLRANFFIFGERCFKLRKLSFLCEERNSAMIMPIGGDALLQSGIVEMPTQRKPPLSFFNSLRAGFNSILERLSSLHGLSIANLKKGGKPSSRLRRLYPQL